MPVCAPPSSVSLPAPPSSTSSPVPPVSVSLLAVPVMFMLLTCVLVCGCVGRLHGPGMDGCNVD
ncbi:MAG: hypothetical protein C0445_10040 [Polaromonas sp.]|nr:hypothetical protein [Polaromonas sp.]